MALQHVIEIERCKGCGLCISVCPKKVLELSDTVSAKGYFPAFQARPADCIKCTLCCIMCPDVAITIIETDLESAVESGVKSGVKSGVDSDKTMEDR